MRAASLPNSAVPAETEDEITPNPNLQPSFPVLPRVLNLTSGSDITTTPEKSYSASSYSDFSVNDCSTTRESSNLSLQHMSGSDFTDSCFDDSVISTYEQTVAVNVVAKGRFFTNAPTKEERQRGFRLSKYPDPRYLGFVPSSHDRRKYITAMPLAEATPPTCTGCYLPISTSQRLVLFLFILILALLAAGGAYFFRGLLVGDIVIPGLR